MEAVFITTSILAASDYYFKVQEKNFTDLLNKVQSFDNSDQEPPTEN